MRWLGFGKESTPSDAPAPVKFFPFVNTDEEMCEDCGAVKLRSEMECFGVTDDGDSLYRCVHHADPSGG